MVSFISCVLVFSEYSTPTYSQVTLRGEWVNACVELVVCASILCGNDHNNVVFTVISAKLQENSKLFSKSSCIPQLSLSHHCIAIPLIVSVYYTVCCL